eukprot:6201915-Pleurochrysis_carterae.AAC.4
MQRTARSRLRARNKSKSGKRRQVTYERQRVPGRAQVASIRIHESRRMQGGVRKITRLSRSGAEGAREQRV